MKLSTQQIKHLRAQAHSLKPVVMVGANGITENLMEESNIALTAHELIKIKVRAEERAERDALIELICKKSDATPVQRVGHNLTLFRRNKNKPKIEIPSK